MQDPPGTYRILCLGDLHFGESYSRAGAPVIRERGRRDAVTHLIPFIERTDALVVNLETPLLNPTATPSPLAGEKSYIHWASPTDTPPVLRDMGVSAVSLANNHTLDHGVEGLTATFETLDRWGIPWFGAGRNLDEARRPFRIELPASAGGGFIEFHGMFQHLRRYDEAFGFYAGDDRPGCAPLSDDVAAMAPATRRRHDTLAVAFPHWGRNYRWRSVRQRDLATALLGAGFDVIIGHGSHCLQQIERRSQRWVAFSIGNGVFLSGGRYQRYVDEHGILPVSAWAILEVVRDADHRRVDLKLYPVYSDNRTTDFRPGPIAPDELESTIETLREHTSNPARFDLEHLDVGSDDLGPHLNLSLGMWPIGGSLDRGASHGSDRSGRTRRSAASSVRRTSPASRLERSTESRDPDPRTRSAFLRVSPSERADRVPWGRYEVSPQLLAVELIRRGYEVTWVDRAWFLYDGQHSGSFSRTTPHLTSGEAIRAGTRKDVTNFMLQRADLSIPDGRVFRRNEVAEAARWARALGGDVVVKPVDGAKGRGVSIGATGDEEFREAFDLAVAASRRARRVLVESRFRGDDTRFFVIGGRAVAAISRRPPRVLGDGSSTLWELIERLNDQRSRSPAQFKNVISLGDADVARLRRLGHELGEVPPAGEEVIIDERTNASTGGATCDVTDEVHPSYFEVAGRCCAAIHGLALAGVDILATDFSQPAQRDNHVVLEVNTKPAIRNHHFPDRGRVRDVAAAVIDFCTVGVLADGPLPGRAPMPGDRTIPPYPPN